MLDTLKTFHSLGIQDGEIFHLKEAATIYEYSSNSIKTKNSGIDEGFGIRILKDKKIGFSYATMKTKLGDAIKNAVSLSKFSVPSEFSFPQKQKYDKKTNAYDAKIVEADETEMKKMVLQIAEGIKKYSEPVRIVLVFQTSEIAIANTSPIFAQQKRTSVTAYAEAKNQNGFGIAEYSHYKMLKNPYKLGECAGVMAKEMKNPKKLKPGKYTVMFSQEILNSIFDLLLFSFSGELKRRKISKIWNKEGMKIFDEGLCIYDDPFADGSGKSAFDDEGTASKKLPLVENGVVKNFYYNRESAALSELEKNGNCIRGSYNTLPAIGSSNTIIKTPNSKFRLQNSKHETENDWLETEDLEQSKYLYIESMHGLHTANTTSGDFGAEASIAFLHDKDKKIPVRGFMISENVFDLFNKIKYIGKNQIQTGDFISPKIVFENITIVS